MGAMTTTYQSIIDQIEADRRANGEFGNHERTEPEVALASGDSRLMWLVEGDDHEYRVYEAETEDEAAQLAIDGFIEQYDNDDDDDDDDDGGGVEVDIVAVFRVTDDTEDDVEDWEYVSGVGSAKNEAHARRALDHADR